MGTTLVTGVLGYVYWIVAARVFSAHDTGLAAALVSAMTLTSTVCNLGIHSTLIQTLPGRARGRDWSATLNAGLLLGIMSSSAGAAGVLVALPLLSPGFAGVAHSWWYLLAFGLGIPLWTISTLLDATFVAQRNALHMLIRNSVFSAMKIPLLLVPFILHLGAMGILVSWTAAAGVSVIAALTVQVPSLNCDYRPAVRALRTQLVSLRHSLAGHHFINLGGMAPMYVLPLLVASRLSPTENAYFYSTWMVCSLFFMASASVAQSLFAEGAHADHDLTRKVRSSACLIVAFLAPVSLFFLLAGSRILGLFGPSYARHGTALLLVLLLSAVPDGITNIYVSVLRVQRRLRHAALLNLCMAALVLVLAWQLLPQFGIVAAGWAWIAGQSAGTLVALLDVAAHRRWKKNTRSPFFTVVDVSHG